jgi:dienelactone hydrolase
MSKSTWTRKTTLTLATTLVAVVVGGCTIPPPPGAGTVRYRDPVFSTYVVTHDIQYGSAVPQGAADPIPLKLDLYQPPASDTQTQRPAVVWVHGGSFCCGDKSSGPSPDLAQKFAKLGYVTASINYRLISTACSGGSISAACYQAALDAQHDAQAAVRYLRANAVTLGIDPTRIGIGGESAGAITATLVGVHSEDPGTSGNPGPSSSVGGFSSISGGLPSGLFAGAGDAPGVLFHGTADPIVPYKWSTDTTAALLSAKVPAFIEPLDGAGHVPYGQYGNLFYQQSDYFFYDLLDLGHAAGQPVSVRRAADRQERRLAQRHPYFARTLRARRRAAAHQSR